MAFMFPPYSEPDFGGEGRGHGGFEYEIAAAAAGSLGLNLVLRPPSTGVMWGSRVEGTDNFTGTNKDVLQEFKEVTFELRPNCLYRIRLEVKSFTTTIARVSQSCQHPTPRRTN